METADTVLRPPDAGDVERAVARLVRALNPLRIDVFGSVARGTAGPHSDLDLLVVFDELAWEDKRSARVRAREAIGGLGVAVDVIATSPAEIERRGGVIGTVLREALLHGRTVYDRPVGDGS